MVEPAEPKWTWRDGWWAVALVGVLVGVIAAGWWSLGDVETPVGAYPALTIAMKAVFFLFLAAALACLFIVVWDRQRQTGPESEQELSLEAIFDVRRGLARPLIANLAHSFLMLAVGLIIVPDFLTLIAQQAWPKVAAAIPLMLLMAYGPFSRYPALIRNWRARGGSESLGI